MSIAEEIVMDNELHQFLVDTRLRPERVGGYDLEASPRYGVHDPDTGQFCEFSVRPERERCHAWQAEHMAIGDLLILLREVDESNSATSDPCHDDNTRVRILSEEYYFDKQTQSLEKVTAEFELSLVVVLGDGAWVKIDDLKARQALAPPGRSLPAFRFDEGWGHDLPEGSVEDEEYRKRRLAEGSGPEPLLSVAEISELKLHKPTSYWRTGGTPTSSAVAKKTQICMWGHYEYVLGVCFLDLMGNEWSFHAEWPEQDKWINVGSIQRMDYYELAGAPYAKLRTTQGRFHAIRPEIIRKT